jgi:cofilin
MSQSGATVNQECVTAYNDLKLNKKYKYIIFKLSDDNKEIVVESTSEDGPEYEDFRNKLISAEVKTKTGAVSKGPRYAVYDIQYELASGEGIRNKITFIAWSPDDAGIKPKMVYASSKDALKRALTGLAHELQANDTDDIEWDTLVKTVSKGTAAAA